MSKPSANELSVAPVFQLPRAKVPEGLTAEQSAEWRAIVDALPAEHFSRDTYGLLEAYVVRVCRLREIRQLVEQVKAGDPMDVKAYLGLCKAENDCSRVIAGLATKMRIAQQSTIDERKRKPALMIERPW